jgi:hypothetical protein
MWEQYFSQPNFTARTSTRATTAKFNQHDRDGMTQVQRSSEVKEFARHMSTPGFVDTWNARVRDCERQTIARLALEKTSLDEQLVSAVQRGNELSTELETIRDERDRLRVALDVSEMKSDELAATVETMVNSRSWRITAPLRKIRALLTQK